MVDWGRESLMRHFIKGENVALMTCRQSAIDSWEHVGITKLIADDSRVSNRSRERGYIYPLYLYPETGEQQTLHQTAERTPNLNAEIVDKIAERIGLTFVSEKETTPSLRATPPKTGGEFGVNRELEPKSSPPFEGGVSAGRGGFETSVTRESKERVNNLPYLKTFRKNLRNNLTPAEATFWKVIQNKQFEGRKFRRQHSVGNYILDFYCPSEKLAIELDGEVHFNETAREYDYERKLFLEHYGIKVLRFENKLVFEELGWVLGVVKSNFGWNKTTTPSLRDTPPLEGGEPKSFAPIDVLDYIYAVLHSPDYREKYKEFLKIDFPRVPYPKDAATFWQMVNLGGELRQIHLLDAPAVSRYITTYPNSGDNIVARKMTTASIGFELTDAENASGRVWINDEQFFDKVPRIAWEFYIGGYQPAQKWLKDRVNRELSVEDIRHYQKIIVALSETERLMREIDKIENKI
jgi:very-short-patch-repair endonuclease